MKRLNELAVGEWGVVRVVEGKTALRRRLETMGFVPGVWVRVSHCAPMGDPRAYELLWYCISLRNEEAELVLVEPVKVYSLNKAPPGRFKVLGVSGGRGVVDNLTKLGVVPDALLVRKDNRTTGPITIEIQGQTVQLGRGVARRVIVTVDQYDPEATD
ncbi:MAG: FeoA family protein [bacterium]